MYTTESKVEKYLAVDIGSSLSSTVTDWITAVETWIERYTGKSFEADSAETRYYDGNGRRSILIDPFISGSITSVQILDSEGNVDDTLTEGHGDDFLAYPLNENEQNELVLSPSSTRGSWDRGKRTIAVTAQFGHSSSVPKDIELIATKLVGEIIREGLKGGKLARVELGDYKATFVTIDEKASALGIYQTLDQYRDLEC